ncbi:hypothetical protein VKT23_011248 [Stygiomarasmius scandens]|uniref:Methyltransferase ausD n=1 Tax=Marasmiellus scandens TaxID=2682957 RepID=A0ABR1J904_9AGAR
MTSETTQSEEISFYFKTLSEDDITTFKKQSGIEDDEELRRHVEDVASRARKIRGYLCLNRIWFLKTRIVDLPEYKDAVELGKTREGAIFLDIGCCLGHDTRRIVMDGFPVQNVIASDLESDFWQLGHELFRSTPQTFPAAFMPGNIFDDEFLPNHELLLGMPTSARPQSLKSLPSLAPLRGQISVIHVSSLFHLFQEEPQCQLAKKLASLLSPQPGSLILGRQAGLAEPGERVNSRGERIFCHSVDSWKKLWAGEGGVFPLGTVEVKAEFEHSQQLGIQVEGFWDLVWSVKRI